MRACNTVSLGTDANGATFTFDRVDPYIARGEIQIDVWNGSDGAHDAASVTLNADDALTLVQTLEGWLDR